MGETTLNSLSTLDPSGWLSLLTSPTIKTLQLVVVVYLGLLWLSIIIWVTRDAINRSNNLLFQAFSILLNILFPVLGTLLYLIIRPGKTVAERYYEELEHRLILESIQEKKHPAPDSSTLKMIKKKNPKKSPNP